MSEVIFHGRQAVQLENEALRLTVLKEGGHIAEVFDKRAGVSPLWIPQWTSMEPSAFERENPGPFGSGSDGKLLAGLMGHNLCLDIFGGPSTEEEAAGLTAHGEASVNCYEVTESGNPLSHELVMQLTMPLAQLKLSRTIQLHGENVRILESVENLNATDHPLAWTQHVTLGPPFLDPATTEFRASMGQSIVSETDPGNHAYLKPGAEFVWPNAPRPDGSEADLQHMNATAPASGYTAHLADTTQENAFFIAYTKPYQLAFGYVWKQADFPWMGIWEENCSRPGAPWNGSTITRGMEFGVSPFPESRRAMIERNRLMGAPTYKWIPARGRLDTEYWIVSQVKDAVPEMLAWPTV